MLFSTTCALGISDRAGFFTPCTYCTTPARQPSMLSTSEPPSPHWSRLKAACVDISGHCLGQRGAFLTHCVVSHDPLHRTGGRITGIQAHMHFLRRAHCKSREVLGERYKSLKARGSFPIRSPRRRSPSVFAIPYRHAVHLIPRACHRFPRGCLPCPPRSPPELMPSCRYYC